MIDQSLIEAIVASASGEVATSAPLPRCITHSGPLNAKIAIVGEAPGETEEMLGKPFVGSSGQELDRMLEQAGIDTHACFKTNVFHVRPPGNNLLHFCTASAKEPHVEVPPYKPGKYFRAEFQPEYDRLYSELTEVRPNLILALGNVAMGAIIRQTGISKARGTLHQSPYGKVLPTYHPSAVLRSYDLRPIVVTDFIKSAREHTYPDIRIPSRQVLIDPTIFEVEMIYDNNLRTAEYVVCDIETKYNQVRCVGFAWRPDRAIVIPFTDWRQKDYSYWRSPGEERRAWDVVRAVLGDVKVKKIFQNGLYDVQYLWRQVGIPTVNWSDDTMIMHHALFPEMEKNLGFLGSIYTDEPAWKIMRSRTSDHVKREE